LFYICGDDRLVSVPVHWSSDGTTGEFGTPVALFMPNVGSTGDDQSFVMNSVRGEAAASPMAVSLN
jgi:hypothetical protein